MTVVCGDLDNVYLREFLGHNGRTSLAVDFNGWLRDLGGGVSAFERRRACVRRYAFGVPNAAALDAIARCAPIVELGAGTGYWAYLLRARGVDIVAYDVAPPDQAKNAYKFDPRTWTSVHPGGIEVLDQYQDRTLFLCWPGYRDTFAEQALARYRGDRLIYVGEDAGGHTADQRFFERLHRDWLQQERIAIPQWPGAHDFFNIYHRQQAD